MTGLNRTPAEGETCGSARGVEPAENSQGLFRSGTAANIPMTSGFTGTLFVMSLYLQDGRGLGALAAGLSIFPEAVGVAVRSAGTFSASVA